MVYILGCGLKFELLNLLKILITDQFTVFAFKLRRLDYLK